MNRELSISLCFSLLLLITTQLVYAEPVFSFKIGSLGTADGQLKSPNDVIVSTDGKTIYVVDTDNHRINVFDNTRDHDFKFGSFCDMGLVQNCNDNTDGANDNGDGQFYNPTSGTLDSFGHFFVVDSDNERIQRFANDGEFELKFGSSDNTKSEYLGAVQGIATLKSTKEIYVSSIDTDSISVFDSSGKFLFNFDSFDGNDSLKNPSHMIIDNNDETLYVSDTGNDRILIFKLVTGTCPSGTSKATDGICFVKEFGSSGTTDGKFDSPSGLALDATNDLLYVADTDNDKIQVFKLVTGTCPSGTSKIVDGVCFTEKFGSSGTTDGKFDSPSGLALDATNDLLYVADTGNDRLQAFTLNSAPASLTPSSPKNLKTLPLSPASVILTWDEPVLGKDVPSVTGYKIEYKTSSTSYTAIIADTKSKVTSFMHEGLDSNTTYSYQVSAINSKGISNPSSSSSVKPAATTVPGGLIATAISPNQIKLSWQPPSNTFGQSINGYSIQRVITTDVYDTVGSTNGKTTSYIVSNLVTDKTYSFVVTANIGYGSSGPSNTASTTPRTSSIDVSSTPSSSVPIITIPASPIKLTASTVSSTQINLSWNPPLSDGNSPITGYKIEVSKDSGSNSTLVADAKSTTYSHTNLMTNSKYTYKVYAINSAGTSTASNEVTATPMTTLKMNPLGKLTIDEGKPLSFAVKVTDATLNGLAFSLDKNPPIGAKINSNTGMFTWTPTDLQGAKSYVFDIVVNLGSLTDRQSITIAVNDVLNKPEPSKEPEPAKPEPSKELGLAPFVDKLKDPQSYVDRYNKEPKYKEWFDANFPEYSSIYEAVGLDEPKGLASFVDKLKDPQSYVDRYNKEPKYKEWFDANFPEYSSIYEAVGLDEPKTETPKTETPKTETPKTETPQVEKPQFGICGSGTKLIDGICTIIEIPKSKPWWKFW